MTLSGRLVTAASFVIEIDEVFDDRITSGRQSLSRSRKSSDLISNALARRLNHEVAPRQPHPVHRRRNARHSLITSIRL